jgi:hypothetical protein
MRTRHREPTVLASLCRDRSLAYKASGSHPYPFGGTRAAHNKTYVYVYVYGGGG